MFGNDPSQYALRNELATCNNGIGTVYLAQHKPSGEHVAIKRFRLDKTKVDNHIISVRSNPSRYLQIHSPFSNPTTVLYL